MKVKMLVSMKGTDTRSPGDVIEVETDEAERLIAAGFAEKASAGKEAKAKAVKKTSKRETATTD